MPPKGCKKQGKKQNAKKEQNQKENQSSNQFKKNQKSKPETSNKSEDESNIDDDDDAIDEKNIHLRRVEVVLDPKTQVPLCYSKFFRVQETIMKNYMIVITIRTNKRLNKKTTTEISWDPQNNPFNDKKLKDIESELKNYFSTTCTTVDKCKFVLFGSFIHAKKFLIDKYGIKDDKIRLNFQTNVVPPFFKVTLVTKLGLYNTRISWDTNKWTDESYKDFVEEFRLKLKDFGLKSICNKTNCKIEFVIDDNCINKFVEYFKGAWHMRNDQFVITEIPRDNEKKIDSENDNYKIKDPYNKMIYEFKDFPDDSYYYQMSETIQDAYKIDYHKFDSIKIKANLILEKTGSETIKKDDEESKTESYDYWVTKIDVLSRFSIDGIQMGRFLFKGDKVLIQYKERGKIIEGRIILFKRGNVTVLFKLPKDELPPGVKISDVKDEEKNEQAKDDDDEEEEEKFEDYYQKVEKSNRRGFLDNDDNEYDYDNENMLNDGDYDFNEEEDSEPPYIVTFRPDDTVYRRYGLGLLSLKSMSSTPLKKIIKTTYFDRSINEITDDGDEFIEIENKMVFEPNYLDRLSEEEKKKIEMPLTSSQKTSVKMILENYISVVHGPPGCGKTFSIGLFVYHLLKQSHESNPKILLCAYSYQAVESIVSFVSPIAKALNKNLVWLPKSSLTFETEDEYNNASGEQKQLSIYKIMKRKETEEVYQFKMLQQKKWNYQKIKSMKNKQKQKLLLSDPKNRYTAFDENRLYQLQNQIEKNLVSESDIICCTLIASGKSNIAGFNFDYVIIDEASQADQMTSLVPLIHHPKKIILLGDHNQLDANTLSELKITHPNTSQSLYQKLLKNHIQHTMLKTQFRMNPKICEFPNTEFYNGLIKPAKFLDVKTKVNLESIPTPIAFIDVPNGEEEKVYGLTFKNEEETKVVERLLKNFKMNNVPGNQVGVITPYHEQSEILKEMQRKMKYKGVRISCVDNFQGCERDFIIFSMVRTNRSGNFGFITNRNRLNVSLTRARKGLIIVGNYSRLSTRNRTTPHPENEVIIRLCEFYKKEGCVINSNLIKELKNPVKRKLSLEIEMIPKVQDSEFYGDDSKNKVAHIVDIINDEFDMGDIIEADDECEEKVAKFDEEYDFESDNEDHNDDMKYFIQ